MGRVTPLAEADCCIESTTEIVKGSKREQEKV